MTAKEWKEQNPNLESDIRNYANIPQLVILSNLENLNAEMINQGIAQNKRLERLNQIVKKQFKVLQNSNKIKQTESLDDRKKLLL